MKLYSDEEANYLCRDYRDIPFELRQMLFDKILDDNHISQFNPSGKKKRDYSTPANINLFSEAVGNNYGIDSTLYRKQYNKMYDKNVKNKYNKQMEDRKRDDDLAKYENILAMLRNPKGEFKLVDVPNVDAYSDAIITDINGMLMDMSEMQGDINKKEGRLARMEAEEIEMRKDETAESFVAGIFKNADRSFFKGVDTSIEEIGIADMDIIDKDFTTLASIGQTKRRQREKEARENIAGVEESKNEEYQI
tara:strand:+ start:148 stop:897 length:750 start_codon:yes stop_codon:yes gene_type:complete